MSGYVKLKLENLLLPTDKLHLLDQLMLECSVMDTDYKHRDTNGDYIAFLRPTLPKDVANINLGYLPEGHASVMRIFYEEVVCKK